MLRCGERTQWSRPFQVGLHHSMNYRSVVSHGVFQEANKEEAENISIAMVESIALGRSKEVRLPNKVEMAQTKFLLMDLDTAAAKIRTGPPNEDKADLEIDTWAGVLPYSQGYSDPIPDQYASDTQKTKSVDEVLGK